MITILKVKNINDKTRILTYIRSLSKLFYDEFHTLKNYLVEYFNHINIYSESDIQELSSQLKQLLKNHAGDLINSFKYYDKNQTGMINFEIFKKILHNLNLNFLSDSNMEFLIYIMKRIKGDESNYILDEMKYQKILNILEQGTQNTTNTQGGLLKKDLESNSNQKSNLKSDVANSHEGKIQTDNANKDDLQNVEHGSIPEQKEEDDEEVVLTMKEFDQKVDRILSKLADILLQNKSTVRNFFKSVMAIHSVNREETYEVIPLVELINIVKDRGLTVDTIDIYCIYTKLKYSDEFEMIDVNKLIEEMLNYGIFEDQNQKNFLESLSNYLIKEQKSFDQLLFSIIGRVKMVNSPNGLVKVINQNDFTEFIKGKISGLTVCLEDEFLFDGDINISAINNVLNKLREQNGETAGIKEKNMEDLSVDFDNLEDMEIDGLN